MIQKKMFIPLLILTVLLALSSACSERKVSVNTAGSTTVLPIVQAAAEIYMEKNPQINISVRGGGSGVGIKSVISRIIDIGNASRRLEENELELLGKEHSDLVETAIAKDAISIVVHPDNPVNGLNPNQLKHIYSGQITNWKEITGWDKQIIVIGRDVSSGSFMIFNQIVLDSTRVTDKCMKLASNNAVATAVSYTPGAIGYIGLGYVNDGIKLLAIDGVLPNRMTAVNNEYKLTRLLYMYTSQSAGSKAQDFIDFILSEEGQQIVEAQGYLRVK